MVKIFIWFKENKTKSLQITELGNEKADGFTVCLNLSVGHQLRESFRKEQRTSSGPGDYLCYLN